MSANDRPEWQEHAACIGEPPEMFFPKKGGVGPHLMAMAKAICATCPVRVECLEYALENGEEVGVWGGTSERQRRQIRWARRGLPPLPRSEPNKNRYRIRRRITLRVAPIPQVCARDGCDVEFTPTTYNRKFCSDRCERAAANARYWAPRRPVRVYEPTRCEGCDTVFTPRDEVHRFCSERCRRRIARLRQKAVRT